jgi:hypothetical protein
MAKIARIGAQRRSPTGMIRTIKAFVFELKLSRLSRTVPALMLMLALLVSVTNMSAQPSDDENAVKAAFVYNFVKFVEWPAKAFEHPDSPIILTIVGNDPIGQAIERTVQGKTVDGRTFVVKHLKWDQNLRASHVLFICASEKDHLSQLAGVVKGTSILTVGETPGFAGRHGIIGFFLDHGRVRFEINEEAAKRAQLSISSRLLSLAKLVSDTK